MNPLLTRCPACATYFKVTAAQLAARDGLVRCGRCQAVFNAREHLLPDEHSPQLSLPIDKGTTSEGANKDLSFQADTEGQRESGSATAPAEPVERALASDSDLVSAANASDLEAPSATLTSQAALHDATPAENSAPGRKRRTLSFIFGLMLFLLLLTQASYFFRDELALRLPGLKPLLEQLCEPLACTLTLPHDADKLTILSSELVADATHPEVFTLRATLRNDAPYVQALPSLELTLTDSNDRVLARRILAPADYLQAADQHLEALAAKRELTLSLPLRAVNLRPAGYRILLFYPDHP